MNRKAISAVCGAVFLGAVGGTLGAVALRVDAAPAHAAVQPGEMGQMLINAMLAVEGCLGAEAAQTQSGKSVIFGWFENKAAARRWYDSQMHQGVMRMAMPGVGQDPEREPMAGVPDDVPLMAIASLTMSDMPRIEGVRLPISAISIELYTPLTGGVYINERFSPEGLKVEGMRALGAP
ncbi:MAG: hypothetical protein EA379_11315 [Phycisphaerales bacterium]|nr:MAG: hypothetical protein EA379_11315 [Phycisphaerales bacterium]